jgi:hypothetical protein
MQAKLMDTLRGMDQKLRKLGPNPAAVGEPAVLAASRPMEDGAGAAS